MKNMALEILALTIRSEECECYACNAHDAGQPICYCGDCPCPECGCCSLHCLCHEEPDWVYKVGQLVEINASSKWWMAVGIITSARFVAHNQGAFFFTVVFPDLPRGYFYESELLPTSQKSRFVLGQIGEK